MLKLGQPSAIDYESGDEATRVEVAPSRVQKGSISDFQGFRRDAQMKRSIPYYVTVKYKNVGDAALKYPSLSGRGPRGPLSIFVKP
jgi:hypothetical protein